MSAIDLIIDLHRRNDRQGPGSTARTRLAIELAGLKPCAGLAVADVGCGTGASALVLAGETDAFVTAIDSSSVFIETLRQRAERAGLASRIRPMVGHMEALPFEDHSLDVIWSEGAIYNIGFAAGVRAWRRFLKPGGVIALSELSWTTSDRPKDVEAHWLREYGEIETPASKFRVLEEAGYSPVGFFFLPRECWEEQYYAPLRAGFGAFLDRSSHSVEARRIVEAEEQEMRMYRERGQWYGYGFYIARRTWDE
jgi:SAM-dependent methyltransferase